MGLTFLYAISDVNHHERIHQISTNKIIKPTRFDSIAIKISELRFRRFKMHLCI
jgi:hypothetical protein